MCVSCAFFLSCPIPICVVLFYHILFYYYSLNACWFSNKSQKGSPVDSDQRSGEDLGEVRGRKLQ